MSQTPPRLPTATLHEIADPAQAKFVCAYDVRRMATELLALRAAGDALAGAVEAAVEQEGPHLTRRVRIMRDAARAWRMARGEG